MDSCCSPLQASTNVCPRCDAKGKAVSLLTVQSLAKEPASLHADTAYLLCRTKECPVVYFAPGTLLLKKDVAVRVGFKESEDPIPLCYCFGYARGDIRNDLALTGHTEIPEKIKAEIQAGRCSCEIKNPAGSCCLGDILAATKALGVEVAM